jgi:hypothetical protein
MGSTKKVARIENPRARGGAFRCAVFTLEPGFPNGLQAQGACSNAAATAILGGGGLNGLRKSSIVVEKGGEQFCIEMVSEWHTDVKAFSYRCCCSYLWGLQQVVCVELSRLFAAARFGQLASLFNTSRVHSVLARSVVFSLSIVFSRRTIC